MEWQAVAGFATAFVAFAGLNIGALQWMFSRHDAAKNEHANRINENYKKIVDVEKALLELRADLPLEYVRREDWIRFGNTLEAKLDALRSELRAEIGELKGSINARV
jgi:cbb3-type cytochrome oxidase subunit 3